MSSCTSAESADEIRGFSGFEVILTSVLSAPLAMPTGRTLGVL